MIKRFGSGSTIPSWKDPWILDIQPRQTTKKDIQPRPATCKGHNFHPTLMVNQLINPATRMWNMELMKELIKYVNLHLILDIHVTGINKEDTLGWHRAKAQNKEGI